MIARFIAVFLAKAAVRTGLIAIRIGWLKRIRVLTYNEIMSLKNGDTLIDGLGEDHLIVCCGEAPSGTRWFRIQQGPHSYELRGPWAGGLVDSVTLHRRPGFEDNVYVLKGANPQKGRK